MAQNYIQSLENVTKYTYDELAAFEKSVLSAAETSQWVLAIGRWCLVGIGFAVCGVGHAFHPTTPCSVRWRLLKKSARATCLFALMAQGKDESSPPARAFGDAGKPRASWAMCVKARKA